MPARSVSRIGGATATTDANLQDTAGVGQARSDSMHDGSKILLAEAETAVNARGGNHPGEI
jgi:hypothetical protein